MSEKRAGLIEFLPGCIGIKAEGSDILCPRYRDVQQDPLDKIMDRKCYFFSVGLCLVASAPKCYILPIKGYKAAFFHGAAF